MDAGFSLFCVGRPLTASRRGRGATAGARHWAGPKELSCLDVPSAGARGPTGEALPTSRVVRCVLLGEGRNVPEALSCVFGAGDTWAVHEVTGPGGCLL